MAYPKLALMLVPVALVMAGCAGNPDSRDPEGAGTLDTGTIPPGSEKTLTFADARSYKLHCDPHPFMTHNVAAQTGGASTAHVHIRDGNATGEFRYDPHEITVGPSAVVTYHNHGSLPHTATELTGEDHGGHRW